MKPLNDFAFDSRQAIIHGPESKRRHYQRCIDRGMSEFDAVRMSGYHPIDELERPFGRAVMAVIVFAAFALLALASGDAFASGSSDDYVSLGVLLIECWSAIGAVYLLWFLVDAWIYRNEE